MAFVQAPVVAEGDSIVNVDPSTKLWPDYKAEGDEYALITMHTIPFEGSVGLINQLTATRLLLFLLFEIFENFKRCTIVPHGSTELDRGGILPQHRLACPDRYFLRQGHVLIERDLFIDLLFQRLDGIF